MLDKCEGLNEIHSDLQKLLFILINLINNSIEFLTCQVNWQIANTTTKVYRNLFLLILINKTLTKITKNVKINKHNIQCNSQLLFFLANNKFDSIFMLFTLSTCQCYALLAHLLLCKKKKINTFLLPFHKTAFCCVYLGFFNSPTLGCCFLYVPPPLLPPPLAYILLLLLLNFQSSTIYTHAQLLPAQPASTSTPPG